MFLIENNVPKFWNNLNLNPKQVLLYLKMSYHSKNHFHEV